MSLHDTTTSQTWAQPTGNSRPAFSFSSVPLSLLLFFPLLRLSLSLPPPFPFLFPSMSRRSAPMLPPPPPTDRDIIMGPPPIPSHQPFTPSSVQNSKDQREREFSEKYYKLKRKYWELEEKYKDLEDELRRSGERNANWNTERGMLLDRILELEAVVSRQPSSPTPHSPNTQPSVQPPTAFPRALQSSHAQNAFQANLHQALDEVRIEDPSVDPLYTSRHIGPQARKRQLEEMKEREEEEARDSRKAPRRGKATTTPNPSKAKDSGVSSPFPPPANPANPPVTAPSSSFSDPCHFIRQAYQDQTPRGSCT
ncbi:hypothetical protein B0F90DRAFT_360128 [Multifurca ochricompacta]|uniref:Uncharacterized protein n=1 Tax=Multifurca ochricompacta TaxID=376703 RepID=A0AAD4M4S0_9AGAM|nr:hypothetical protein B0F90DRAFT_360128 [Multifurca ochricompacta]